MLRRRSTVVIVGAALAILLAVLAVVRISPSGVSYRHEETWSNEATLALSEASLPELRASLSPSARPERLATLIDVYAAFATSDAVIASLRGKGLLTAKDLENGRVPIAATAVPSTANAGPTPLLRISGSGPSKERATELTVAATKELIEYVKAGQVQASIPEKERVELRTVKASTEPVLVKARSMSNAIVILLAMLTATVATAFIRDNMLRRRGLVEQDEIAGLWVPAEPHQPRDDREGDHPALAEMDVNGSGPLNHPRPGELTADPARVTS